MAKTKKPTKETYKQVQKRLDKEFPKVKSWSELRRLCEAGDERYQKLCCAGIENLGGPDPHGDWEKAYSGLQDYIMALEGEYSVKSAKQEVLDEVNYVRECIDQITLKEKP